MENTIKQHLKVKAHSVEPVRLPTEFAELNADLSVYEKSYVDCSGCENKNASTNVIEKLSQAIKNHPELVWDHWNPQDRNLRKKIANLHGVSIDQVFITAGAITGIDYCFKIFGKPGTRLGLLKPDWPGFLHFAEFYKSEIKYLENLQYPFIIDCNDISNFSSNYDIDIMLFANPVPVNGYLIEKSEIEKILMKNTGTLFIIDEADTLSPDKQSCSLTNDHDNVIFLGSLSKFYGLSGLRIGYLIAPKIHASHFNKTINPIEVSSLAILAGNLILDDLKYQEWTQDNVKESIHLLREACKGTEFEITASQDCFACYIHSKSSNPKNDLLKHNIKILQGQYFGLPENVNGGRFNLADPENSKLVADKIKEISRNHKNE